jgi:hypothetical protein
MAEYAEHLVVEQLGKKHDLRVVGNTIQELLPPASKGDIGKKSRGKIDFLKKFKGYRFTYVDSFNVSYTRKN